MSHDVTVVVFCHLRWNFVYQRPQHILSRLAQSQRVIFIEEPIYDPSRAGEWEIEQVQDNLLVCRPITAIESPGFHEDQMAVLKLMVDQLTIQFDVRQHWAWLYTPMATPLLDAIDPSLVIYDCMDALDAFLNAPPLLRQREQELLERADVVFTGGRSLFNRLQQRHGNVHCFASSVDAAHFATAKDTALEHAEQRSLSRPRLGYFGVIDERIDLNLLKFAATARPEWNFVMVGPVVKIDPAALPQADNIHYFGKREYADLPAFISGWDVGLLPFALNDATRYISPTKTLEYMAAEKPIVSTPITDVAEPFKEMVYLADSPASFVEQCELALHATAAERQRRLQLMRQVLAATSWNDTVERMQAVLRQTLARADANSSTVDMVIGRILSDDILTGDMPLHVELQPTPPVIVIGAGPTGLSAAYHLGQDALLLEKNGRVGGWCRSIEVNGFTFDFAGHIMFSNDPYVHELYKTLLKENVHWQDREAWIYSKNVFTRYPFQGALYGLPPQVIKECIMGAIEARYGADHTAAEKSPVARLENANAVQNGAKSAATSGNGNGQAGHANGNGNGNGNGSAHLNSGTNQNSLCSTQNSTDNKPIVDCYADGVLESTVALKGIGKNRVASIVSQTTSGGSTAAGNHGAAASHKLPTDQHRGNGNATKEAKNGADQPVNGQAITPAKPRNFEEFIYQVWGAGIAKHFAIPYNRKLWAVPLSEMETSWLGGRVPMPNLEDMIDGALHPVPRPMGPNARFGYPLVGGFQALMDGFLPFIEEQLRLNSQVAAISPSRKTISLADGQVIPYRHLISTMPLPVLIRQMHDEAPPEIQHAAASLRHVSVRCVHLGIGRENITDKHWIYYPEQTVFHRIFVQGNASPHCNAVGGFGLTCEITYSPHKPLPCDGDALIQRCIDDCRDVEIIKPDDPIWAATQVDLPYAYVVYDHDRPKHVTLIREWLKSKQIVLAGRYSEWEYYNSDHAFVAGKIAADAVRASMSKSEDISAQEQAPVQV